MNLVLHNLLSSLVDNLMFPILGDKKRKKEKSSLHNLNRLNFTFKRRIVFGIITTQFFKEMHTPFFLPT